MGSLDYPLVVFWSDEDACFVADFPDLRYCSAFGDTPEEAVTEARTALGPWLAAVRERGDQPPPPSTGAAIVDAARDARAHTAA